MVNYDELNIGQQIALNLCISKGQNMKMSVEEATYLLNSFSGKKQEPEEVLVSSSQGDIEEALNSLIQNLIEGKCSHRSMLYNWDISRGDDRFTATRNKGVI